MPRVKDFYIITKIADKTFVFQRLEEEFILIEALHLGLYYRDISNIRNYERMALMI